MSRIHPAGNLLDVIAVYQEDSRWAADNAMRAVAEGRIIDAREWQRHADHSAWMARHNLEWLINEWPAHIAALQRKVVP
jgi:hypothetical protein